MSAPLPTIQHCFQPVLIRKSHYTNGTMHELNVESLIRGYLLFDGTIMLKSLQ